MFTGISINLVGRLRSGASFYAANGFYPDLTFDFYSENYAKSGSGFASTLSDVATFSRASSATYTDSDGIIQTATTNTPRVGHHTWDGSQWVNQGLLLESEARTNLITYSEAFDNAAWSKFNSSVTSNATTAPDGTLTADLWVPASSGLPTIERVVAVSSAVDYTFSIFLKAQNITSVFVREDAEDGVSEIVNLIDGTSSGSLVKSVYYGDGWYRFYYTTQIAGSGLTPEIRATGTPNGTDGIYIWGAQLEAGSTPSSYIPTEGSTATRAAETLPIPAANLPYSATAMSIAMEGTVTYAVGASPVQIGTFVLWAFDADNGINIGLIAGDTSTGRPQFQQEIAAVSDFVRDPLPGTYSPGINVSFSIASRHGSTFINGAVDGTALTANTTPTALPDLSETDLQLGFAFMGTISSFRMWGQDIGDTGISEASQ